MADTANIVTARKITRSLRRAHPGAEHLYSHGGCYSFFKILEASIPRVSAHWDKDFHVYAVVDGRAFDIFGDRPTSWVAGLRPMTPNEKSRAAAWKDRLALTINGEQFKG